MTSGVTQVGCQPLRDPYEAECHENGLSLSELTRKSEQYETSPGASSKLVLKCVN